MVTVKEKKQFIRWLLNNYQMKRRETVWILNYMLSHDSILSSVRFVEQVHYTPRGLLISTMNSSDTVPIKMYRNDMATTDADKIFHELRANGDEVTFVQIFLGDMNTNAKHMYYGVLEENPHVPDFAIVSSTLSETISEMMDSLISENRAHILMSQIDECLRSGDRDRFYKLSAEYKFLTDHRELVGKKYDKI